MAQAWPESGPGVWANRRFAINLNVYLQSQELAIFQNPLALVVYIQGWLCSYPKTQQFWPAGALSPLPSVSLTHWPRLIDQILDLVA